MPRTLALLALAVAAVVALLSLRAPTEHEQNLPGHIAGLRTAGSILRGDGTRSDFAADFVGARALLRREDPYPVLGPAFEDAGLHDWPLTIRSTHPPTLYGLVLPLAGFSWSTASALWAAAMVLALGLSAWAFGARPAVAAAIAPLALLWAPAAWSVGQVTALWLLGAAFAWRWRERPFLAGLAIGLASATKLLPLVLLAPFLLRRRFGALAGAVVALGAGLAPALLLYPDALSRFVEVERAEGPAQAARSDNAGLLAVAEGRFGTSGLAVAIALLVAVAAIAASLTLAERKLQFESYALWLWLSVALLPIAWVYSLLPLAPLLVHALRSYRPAALLAATAIVIPVAVKPFRPDTAPFLAASIALAGLAALLAIQWKPAAKAPTIVP